MKVVTGKKTTVCHQILNDFIHYVNGKLTKSSFSYCKHTLQFCLYSCYIFGFHLLIPKIK
jgi:hypothetical protein